MRKIAIVMIALFAVSIAWTQSLPTEEIVGGPYVVNVRQRSATVMWIVKSGQLTVGTTPDKLAMTIPILRAEKLRLTGLKPGAEHFYQSFAGEAGKGSFKTAPYGA